VATGTEHHTAQLDQVIVRFAGTPAMDAAHGDRFTTSSALLGNDLSTFPDFPRDPGPRRDAERRLGLPGPHLRSRHPHAGRLTERPRGHEPGRLRANIDLMDKGTIILVNSDAFEERNLPRPGTPITR